MDYDYHYPIIHIGFPKCASTYLQQVIFPELKTWKFVMCAETQRNIATKYYDELPRDLLFFDLGRKSRYLYSNEGILQFCYHW